MGLANRYIFLFAVVAYLCAFAGATVAADPRPLRIGLVQQPNSLDPLHAVEFYENYLDEAIFSALCVIDDRGNPSPDLARDVPTRQNGGVSADGKTITYHLRTGVHRRRFRSRRKRLGAERQRR